MNRHIVKLGKSLRTGYTTGTTAAAAAGAAALFLLTGEKQAAARVELPSGDIAVLEVDSITNDENTATCSVIKDGGDDPDATHGMQIFSCVEKTEKGINLDGGEGIGRATKTGLPIKVGEAAINPVPRRMIEKNLRDAMANTSYSGGIKCTIFAPEGVERAKKTFNSRLGIEGGISILGTTGIVWPMSEEALIKTIQLEITQKKENDVLLLVPGHYGARFLNNTWGIDESEAVLCSNYIGEAIDYAAYEKCKRILLVGHVGKLVKIAAGVMQTHSKTADTRAEIYASHAAMQGADANTVMKLFSASTTDDMHDILKRELGEAKLNTVYESICERIHFHLNARAYGEIEIGFMVFSDVNGLLMKTDNADEMIEEIKKGKST